MGYINLSLNFTLIKPNEKLVNLISLVAFSVGFLVIYNS
jgi:hypothetical protein